jgi:protein SCO1
MRSRPQIVLLGFATLLAVALVLVVTLDGPAPRSPAGSSAGSSVGATTDAPSASGFDGAALPGDVPAPGFTLTDQYGHPVSLADHRGQVVVLAFLYSTCGPTCIVIAQQIRGALDELPHPVPVLFVSADPSADTPAHIGRFLESVSLTGRVQYLTGSVSQLRPLWRAYRITPAVSDSAAFDRFASVLLLDGHGRERVLFGEEQLTPESLAHDIRRLQSGA